MLKFVLGGSGSGKTTLLYQRVKARAEAGQRSILLVPEQFTSSTEGRIYRELGDSLSGLVESFRSPAWPRRSLSTEGGAAVQTLSDAGRTVLVRRALEELQDNVHYYYRHRRSAAFTARWPPRPSTSSRARVSRASSSMSWRRTAAPTAPSSANWPSSFRGMKRCWPTPAWTRRTGWSWLPTGWKRHWRRKAAGVFAGPGGLCR